MSLPYVRVFNEEGTELERFCSEESTPAAAVAYALAITKEHEVSALVILSTSDQVWYREGAEAPQLSPWGLDA